MPERTTASAADSAAGGTPGGSGAGGSEAIDIRQVWQLPALGASVLLMLAAVGSILFSAPEPDYGAMLDQASRLLEREQYSEALAHLNTKVLPFAGDQMPAEHRARFFVLRARALVMVQKVHGVDRPENHRTIVAEYDKAEGAGARLEPSDVYRLAMACIALGNTDKALERAQSLPRKEARAQRTEILRRLVEVKFESPSPDPTPTLALIGMFLDEQPGSSDRAWALARQAELLLRQGYAEQAINKLVRAMPGLTGAEAERRGELHMLLARAYTETRAIAEASKELERAVGLLPEADPRKGRALVLLARVDAERGDRDAARQRYTSILEHFPEDPVRMPALLGLAEVLAASGDTEASGAEYGRLVEMIAQGRRDPEVTPEAVGRSLLARYADREGAGDASGALRFATLAAGLYPSNALPPEVLLALARAHRRMAEERLTTEGAGSARLVELSHLDPETREQARVSLVAAADAFRRHAAAVVDLDNEAFGNSLWLAADSFDRAGDQSEAIVLYGEFAEGFRNDPRRDEARFRLAQAYQARGDYDLAAAQYGELIEEGAAGGGGPFADASHVPLARALLDNTEESDDARARQLLTAVVNGEVGGSETPGYRDALVILARLDVREGEFARAITRLEEALARFPQERHGAGLLFELAEAHRRDATEIGRALQEEMPETERAALEATRTQRLGRAMALHEQVRDDLAALPPPRRSDADALRLRNSHFYLGDCAYELRDFESAIRLYDAAREAYPRDPASLVAMIQIVNAYVEQGDLKRAATANERARRFYESLPEEVWSDPNLPIGRREWQRWLDSLAVLGGVAGAGEGGEDPARR